MFCPQDKWLYIGNIVKKNKIKPYKPKNLHILEPEDEERRILFMVPKWISK